MGALHLALIVVLLKSASGFKCGPNSHFNVSATACPITCENKDNPPPCNLGCVPRCECNPGFVLDNLGNCIRERDCKIVCGPNSRFNPYAPGCPATCANKKLRRSCKKPSVARCECIPGYVLDHEGKCIRECDCPSCGANEQFNPQATGCPITCENKGFPFLCTAKPVARCECKDGYVLDINGVCTAEANCPRCAPNSRFRFCGSACPKTCENKDLDMVCNLKCVPRCVCQDGFVLDHLGNCIPERECPSCPDNSHFEPAASACQPTCENLKRPSDCPMGAKPGCVCNPGFVLDINGICVPVETCPRCPPNSQYRFNATACVRTCENKDMNMPCRLGFRPRCQCLPGFVLDHNGNCILEASCPRCAPNAEFRFNATACPATCENLDAPKRCSLGFKPRCTCKPGFVLDQKGNCIRESDCPRCQPNAVFRFNATACVRTCENMDNPEVCRLGYEARCICLPGFVLDHQGNCIAESNCPTCPPNSRFYSCASACPTTCANKGTPIVCTKQCVPRCRCIPGFVLDHEGNCIPERNCPSCPENSHFEPRAPICLRTCQNMNAERDCTMGFKARCICDNGYVLDHNGVCILERNCPRCGTNQVFNPKASACPRTCANPVADKECTLGFRARCECARGFILNHEGVCIDERNCPRCGTNQIFNPKASACERTCVNPNADKECTLGIRARCECIKGFVLDHEGNCIAERNCPRCEANQFFNPKASACFRSCANPNADKECTLGYRARCECIRGFILDHEGNCIAERNCPRCRDNEFFNPRAPVCLRSCQNMNAERECTLGTKARCQCIRGFVLDHEGNCISERNCPRCQANAHFEPHASACLRTCENMNEIVRCTLGKKARCVCDQGFVLDHNGVCILEANCPRCGPNEKFNPKASVCIRSCLNLNAERGCTLGFRPRCECIRGFVMDHEGNCIPERNCPKCRANEIFNPHASACLRTCANKDSRRECTLGHKARCECIRGFILDHEGNCIPERNCPSCPDNAHFDPHASACRRTCQHPTAVIECTLGTKPRCVCNDGHILDHNGVCILEANCPKCGSYQFFNPVASACVRTCENMNTNVKCNLGVRPRCQCIKGFVVNHLGRCIPERNCPSCPSNSHFVARAPACVRTCQNMHSMTRCTLGFKARCVCDSGYVLDHNGVCILERNCPRCGPNQIFNPRASACLRTCENKNVLRECKLGVKARCECIRGFVLDHEGNCIPERNCPSCPENSHFEPRAIACMRTCENMNSLVKCTLGFKARCVCNQGYVLDHNGVCILEGNCPRCGPNQIFNPRASACPCTCENRKIRTECALGKQARCECIRGFVLDHEGNCIPERNCPSCQENAHFEPRAVACVRTCENMHTRTKCTLGFKARCVCNRGFVLDHNGICIPEVNCPRCEPNQIFNPRASACARTCQNPNADKTCKLGHRARCECIVGFVLDHEGNCIAERNCPRCQENSHFEPRALACVRTCENMNTRAECALGFKARCVCDRGFVLDHNGVCIREANCPRCGPNQKFNPRASGCMRTCENPSADKDCKLPLKARCECIRGYVLDHEGNCIPERNCPRCQENAHFEPRAPVCVRTCENMNSLRDCTLGVKARCVCDRGYVLDHTGTCIREANCPRCGPNEVFNPRASACARTCASPFADKECKLGHRARCECIRGFVLDHEGNCIAERNCPRCGAFEVFNPKASACLRTCENMNAIEKCRLGNKPRCECIPGYVLDHNGVCIREGNCPKCGAHAHFNPKASACPVTCDNFNKPRHCRLGFVARCECDEGYMLHPNGECVEECDCPVKCPPNAHFNVSASACPITCRNMNNRPLCNRPNIPRCQCDHGFVLNDEGVCIPERDCIPPCGENEHFNWCAPVEPITCRNRNSPRPFSDTCVPRCECDKGFMLNSDGKCVKECECKGCGPNAHYSNCVSNCPRTCSNLNDVLMCSKECRSGGCECDEGFVFDNYGNCVREPDCPDPRCGRHAFFSHHLPNVQITCANRHQRRDVEFSYCSEGGCRCKNGYVLDSYSNCILESDCPK